VNVGLRIVRLQKQQLRHEAIRDIVVDRRTEQDDSILEQATVDVHRPLFAAALLDDVGN
jgi:hypothetical protein